MKTFNKHLTEAIEVPIRDLKSWLALRFKEINSFVGTFEKNLNWYRSTDISTRRDISYYASDERVSFDFLYPTTLENLSVLQYKLSDLESEIDSKDRKLLIRAIGNIIHGHELEWIVKELSTAYPEWKNRRVGEFDKDSPEIVVLFDTTEKLVLQLKKFIDTVVPKLTTLYLQLTGNEDAPLRNAQKIETLYHATTNAQNIMRDGFQDKRPDDYIGLGGSTSITSTASMEPGISFTYDLKTALDIAKCFKEVQMIANGQYKFSSLMDTATREGIWTQVWNHVKTSEGLKDFDEPPDTPEEIAIRAKFGNTTKRMPDTNDKVLIFKLYRAYLAFSPKRYNPVFFIDRGIEDYLNTFRTLPTSQIGVIEADVDISVSSHHPAENEIRVMPSAVVKIKRVIR